MIFGRNPKRTLIRLVCLVTLSIVLFRFVLIPIRVSGLSMAPTYKDGKVSLVNHLAYRWKKPQRGDVVAFWYVPDRVVLLKRIVGLPGERVQILQGHVYVNGQMLEEPYARLQNKSLLGPSPPPRTDPITLKPGEYYFIGDNRPISVYGMVRESLILGKVIF